MSPSEPVTSSWRPPYAVQPAVTLSIFRRGGGDPTTRADRGDGYWMALRTPEGPASLCVRGRPADGEVEFAAWGEGAGWAVGHGPDLLGRQDDPAGFVPLHPQVEQAPRRHPGWRVPKSGLVLHSLIPAIIEQKVTGQEAFGGFRSLVWRFGEAAPGAGGERGLRLMPDAKGWARIPSWEWLKASVDGARSKAAVLSAARAGRLEECADLPLAEAHARMRAIPGVGVWTSAEVAQRALGDADAVSFGDYHVARNIGWALTGTEVDDDGLAELLEPYAGHRYRVQRLLELAGHLRPRHGPRMPPRRHLPTR